MASENEIKKIIRIKQEKVANLLDTEVYEDNRAVCSGTVVWKRRD